MWFIFGVITLVGFSLFSWGKRSSASWEGTPCKKDDFRFTYKVQKGKNGIKGLLVGIDGSKGYDYSFKEESFIDKFFKKLGVSKEYQLGNRDFDDLVYVVSDNSELHRQITENKKISEAVIKLFGISDKYGCSIQRIRHSSGRIWVRFNTGFNFDKEKIETQATEAARTLSLLEEEIETFPKAASSKWKDPFVKRATIILAISTGLAINGILHLKRLYWSTVPFTVDTDPLFSKALVFGVGLSLLFIAFSVTILGRSARTHLVVLELMLVGTFGFVSTLYIQMHDANMEMDSSRALEFEVNVIKKHEKKNKRSTRYFFYVDDWNAKEFETKIEVSSTLYNRANVGNSLLITQRDGFLNFKWVESIE